MLPFQGQGAVSGEETESSWLAGIYKNATSQHQVRKISLQFLSAGHKLLLLNPQPRQNLALTNEKYAAAVLKNSRTRAPRSRRWGCDCRVLQEGAGTHAGLVTPEQAAPHVLEGAESTSQAPTFPTYTPCLPGSPTALGLYQPSPIPHEKTKQNSFMFIAHTIRRTSLTLLHPSK